MVLTNIGEVQIISGFRPRTEKRFYFFLANKNGQRIFKHCIWVKRDSGYASNLTVNVLDDQLRQLGLSKVKEKIEANDFSNTLQVIEKDRINLINLDELNNKLIFDW